MDLNLNLLGKRLQNEVRRVGLISSKRVLEMEDIEFLKVGNFREQDIIKLRHVAASGLIVTGLQTVHHLSNSPQNQNERLSFGVDTLDSIVGGGLTPSGITELCGASGVGKTQLCLQLCITVQLPLEYGGLDSGAVYICTEGKFPSKRLYQMIKYFPWPQSSKRTKHTLGSNVFIDQVLDVDGLRDCIVSRLPGLVTRMGLKLVVVDSIAGVFRGEWALNESSARAIVLRRLAFALHHLARKHQLVVICVNQVTDNPEDGCTTAALGLAWANMTSCRLLIESKEARRLHLVNAPHLAPASADFLVTQRGVEGIKVCNESKLKTRQCHKFQDMEIEEEFSSVNSLAVVRAAQPQAMMDMT